MSSGKQLSFAFGEVSPSLRYRSDAQFYSQALSKLRNAIVRKSGGVSNRPGMRNWIKPEYQENVPTNSKSKVGARIFTFLGSDGNHFLIEVQRYVEGTPSDWVFPDDGPFTPTNFIRVISEDGTETTPFISIVYTEATDEVELNLAGAECTQVADKCFITFNDGKLLVFYYYPQAAAPLNFQLGVSFDPPGQIGTPAALTNLSYIGNSPSGIPVCYLVTQEQTDGAEVVWQEGCSINGHPHAELSSSFDLDATAENGVKQYNVYRSDGYSAGGTSDIRGSSYSLVGRVAPEGSGVRMFRDFLVVPELSIQPPTNNDLYPIVDATISLLDCNIRRMVFYKERALLIYKKFAYTGAEENTFIEGQIGASKLGSIRMFGRPLTPNLIDAFSFTIPADKLSKITNVLVMNRLILFTKDYTFIIRGGQAGVLTYQEVNPELIYSEGCTPDVAPVSAGTRGFFINYDKSKLLTVKFDLDDSVSVVDVSQLSDHLFEAKDIRKLAVTNSGETVVWILKKDGTMLSFSIADDGSIAGYGTHDTDGFIEDITVGLLPNDPRETDTEEYNVQTIYLSVIREGERFYERMAVRNDINQDRFMYADGGHFFGKKEFEDETDYTGMFINIQNDGVGGSYEAGEDLTLIAMGDEEFTSDWVGRVYDFFYPLYNDETEEYEDAKIRLTITAFVDAGTLTATAEDDLPEYLQDAAAQTELTLEEQRAIQVRFLRAYNQLTGLTNLAGKDVSVFADGIVISSPNNSNYDTLTVDTNGVLDLPTYYNYGFVGLPYTSEIETLDLESSDARTFTDTGKNIGSVGIGMRRTSGGFVGQTGTEDILNMEEIPALDKSGYLKVIFPSTWEQTGRVLIKQIDPLPMSILSVYPKGVAGDN